ncbi:hypothetical protein [Chryseobacterium oryctis]|uniref:PH domain-containing protein n=1 Tax=Chryseobacterium oryctis TaxID=2952618 RepID=A0ABT3HQV9_9FLAO|nr:hypothetical protein [Chryseobacterium oryctis]MCW3162174.1 hypothetical protein [Chryseobacterium oryctis]
MKNKIISKSKKSTSNAIIVLIGIILCSLFIYLLKINFNPKNKYENDLKLIGMTVLGGLIIYFIYYFFNQKRFFIYNDYFEIKNLFYTKKYYFSEVKTYYSEYFSGKYNSWTEYYLVLKSNEKITLIDKEYSNFEDFFVKLKSKIKKDNSLNAKLSQPKYLKYAIICGTISLLLFYFSSFFYDFTKLENNQLAFYKSYLKNDIQTIERSKGSVFFEFELINQSQFVFRIQGNSYDAIYDKTNLMQNFSKGRTIIIGIDKEEYDKKIAKNKPLNLKDKYFHFSKIQVEQLKDINNNDYIDLDIVNAPKTTNNYLGIGMFSFFGLLSMFLSFGNFKAYRRLKINPK